MVVTSGEAAEGIGEAGASMTASQDDDDLFATDSEQASDGSESDDEAFLECSNIRSAPSTTDAHVGEQVEGIDIRQDMQAEPSFIVLVQVFVVAGNWIEGNVCAIDGLGNAGKTAPGCESISARLYVPC